MTLPQTKTLNPKLRRYSPAEKKTILKEIEDGNSCLQVSKKYGVHQSTIHKWIVMNKTPNDNESSFSGTHEHWEKALTIWKQSPGLGPAQIKNQMFREGIKISVATVRNILLENGYSPPKAIQKEERILRYEAIRPREIVHMDFKHFYINKQKVYLLLLQDDHSRFICGHKITDSENMDAVIECFEECVLHHGKMQTIMTDAGSAFYSWNGINRFQKVVGDEYGIDQIKAGSPRSNGKVESVNKQIEKELLSIKFFSSLEDASLGIIEWINFYNFKRTHMGLPPGTVPADRFYYQWNICSHEEDDIKNELWENLMRVALKKMNL